MYNRLHQQQKGVKKMLITGHPDTDYPMFRLADAYLIYAEAAARGAGDRTLALQYINALRTRAYGNTSGNISAAQLTADFVS